MIQLIKEVSMRFYDFKSKYGKYCMYSGWMTVEDAKTVGKIPPEFHDLFENDCECGSENIIAPNLKRETCCDPNCRIKIGFRIAEMFSRMGVKGLGYATCAKIYKELLDYDKNLKNQGREGIFKFGVYTEILLLELKDFPICISSTAAGSDFISACYQIRSTVMTFPQLVSSLGIPTLGSNAEKLFAGINCYTELQNIIEKEGINLFCMNRGVHSMDVMFNLAINLKAIAVADFACQRALRFRGLQEFAVCITGRVVCDGKSMTKKEFITLCNQICTDDKKVQLFEFSNKSGAVTVPFVLYSFPSGTEKYNTGLRRGIVRDEFGEHKALMTTTDFITFLKGAMTEWNKRLSTTPAEQLDCYKIFAETLMKMTSSKTTLEEQTITPIQMFN